MELNIYTKIQKYNVSSIMVEKKEGYLNDARTFRTDGV